MAKVQALATLRQLLGYDAVPADYDIAEEMTLRPLTVNLDDLRSQALKSRPDLLAAQAGIRAAQSQIALAKANGKVDLTTTVSYTHVADQSSLSTTFNIPLPVFDRNQGEIARTRFAYTQAQQQADAAADTVLTDVRNNYEAFVTNRQIVQLVPLRISEAGAGLAGHQRICLQTRRRQLAGFSGRRAQLSRHPTCLPPGARQLTCSRSSS